MTDQPMTPPASLLERWTATLGNLARPYTLVIAATASAIATVALAFRAVDLIAGAAFVAANWSGVGVLYGAKALEEGRKAKAIASVEIAKAQTPSAS